MTLLHISTLEQLSTGFDTAARNITARDRMPIEGTTTQLVAVALHELRDWRAVATPLAEIVRAAKLTVDRSLAENHTSPAFDEALAKLELALAELDEVRAPLPAPATPEPARPEAERLATTPEG